VTREGIKLIKKVLHNGWHPLTVVSFLFTFLLSIPLSLSHQSGHTQKYEKYEPNLNYFLYIPVTITL
jgi:hypothetical protein